MKDRHCRHGGQIARFVKVTIKIVIDKPRLETLGEHAAICGNRIFSFADRD